jgi:hypothetical protein
MPTQKIRAALLTAASGSFALAAPLAAQIGGPPSAAQCSEWLAGLAAGGATALEAVTYGNAPACPGAAPVLAQAVRGARALSDTAYLGRLASAAGEVRDIGIFTAALEIADDGAAANAGRVMALMVTVAQLGSGQDLEGYTRPELFTQPVSASVGCGFALASEAFTADHGLPADADRRAARVIDRIVREREPALVQNLARCARTSIAADVPLQVDVAKVKVDYVCGSEYRVQNHSGSTLLLNLAVTGNDGVTRTSAVSAPGIGGWTRFVAPATGTLQMTYDGQPVATVANGGRRC